MCINARLLSETHGFWYSLYYLPVLWFLHVISLNEIPDTWDICQHPQLKVLAQLFFENHVLYCLYPNTSACQHVSWVITGKLLSKRDRSVQLTDSKQFLQQYGVWVPTEVDKNVMNLLAFWYWGWPSTSGLVKTRKKLCMIQVLLYLCLFWSVYDCFAYLRKPEWHCVTCYLILQCH